MKKAIAAIGTSLVMMLGTTVAVAPVAEAHVSLCARTTNAPLRTSQVTQIGGYARIKCPMNGHQASVSVKSWIEVYAPRGFLPGGTWRRLGTQDFDTDSRVAVALPATSLLYGKNRYRTRSQFTIYGSDGSRSYTGTSPAVTYNRYMPSRRYNP